MSKKNKRVAFTFDERSLTTFEEMVEEGHFSNVSELSNPMIISLRLEKTGEERVIIIPLLPRLVSR